MDEPHKLNSTTSLSFLTKGSVVEVSSDEDGLNGAWFVATVIHPPPPVSSENTNNLVYVEYHNLLSDDASSRRLREYANISYVRPSPPPDTNPPNFQLNDLVDAFYRDGWWTGVITEVVDSSNFVVIFENPPDRLQLHISELRIHRKWVGGRWVQPQKQETAGLMFTVGKKVEVSFEGETFRDVWFPATILKNSGNNSFLVKYLQPGTGDQAVLHEATVDYHHIRPSPPHLRDKNFVLLEKVDAFYDCGWWSGVITKELADSRYNVFFKHTKKEREFICSNVRPHMEWKGGKWFSTSQGDTDGRTSLSLTDELIEQTTPSIDRQSTDLDSNDKSSLPSQELKGESKFDNLDKNSNGSSDGQSEEFDSEANAMSDEAVGKTENLSHGKEVGKRSAVKLLQRGKQGKVTEQKTPTMNSSRKRGRLANELKSLQAGVGKGVKVDPVKIRTQETAEKKDCTKDFAISAVMGLHSNGKTVSHGKINEKLSGDGVSNVAQGQTKPVVPQTMVDKVTKYLLGTEGDTAAAASVPPKRKRGRPPRLQAASPKTPVTVDHQNGGVAQMEEVALLTNSVTKSLEENQEPVKKQQQGLEGEQNENAPFTKKKLPNVNPAQASNVRRGRRKFSSVKGNRGRRRTISVNTESQAQDSQDQSKESPTRNLEASVGKSVDTVSDDRPLSRWFEGKQSPVTAHGTEGSIVLSSKASERGLDLDLPFVRSTPLWQTIESMETFQKIPQRPHFRPLFDSVKESAREGLAIGTMITFSNVVEKTRGVTFDSPRSAIEDCLETLVDLETYGFDVKVIRERLTRLLLIKDKQEELEERSKVILEKLEKHKAQGITSDEEIEEIDRLIKELEEKRKQVLLKKEKTYSEIDVMKAANKEIEREMRKVGEEFDGLAAAPL